MSLLRDPSLQRMPTRPPGASDALVGNVAALAEQLAGCRRLFVLTGAGVSTASGIPDYRDRDGVWKRQQPVQYRAFMDDPQMRARYWARSLIGWRSFGTAAPNAAHVALADLERAGVTGLLVTQNVDGLHQGAGARRVIDLHGRLDRVVCTSCRRTSARAGWQHLLESRNVDWVGLDAPPAPDGDADLVGPDFAAFDVPTCPGCRGIVKPDVVFYGEAVPAWRHTQAMASLATSEALLVVGSSLMVQSGFRYAVAADRLGLPLFAVNLGRTRADHLLRMTVDAPAGEALPVLAGLLTFA